MLCKVAQWGCRRASFQMLIMAHDNFHIKIYNIILYYFFLFYFSSAASCWLLSFNTRLSITRFPVNRFSFFALLFAKSLDQTVRNKLKWVSEIWCVDLLALDLWKITFNFRFSRYFGTRMSARLLKISKKITNPFNHRWNSIHDIPQIFVNIYF